MEGEFEEGKSARLPEPLKGFEFHKTYPCFVTGMFGFSRMIKEGG
jgi:hypothetical protein